MARKPKSNAPDWLKIRTEYVQDGLSLRDLAKKHPVSLRQLARKCADEKWVDQRKQHTVNVASAADKADVDWKADYLSKGRKATANNALVIAAAIQAKLKGQKVVRTGRGAEDYIDISGLSPLQIADLARANDVALKSLCNAVGVDPVAPDTDGLDLPDDPLADLEEGSGEKAIVGRTKQRLTVTEVKAG